MSNLLDLSGKLNPVTVALFEALSELAGTAGIRFFVVGATARDMIFELGHDLPSKRGTLDVDVGVHVSTWDMFNELKESLIRSGRFTQTKEVQRLQFQGQLLVDILPFGELADARCEIHWPPDQATAMSVVGFHDAYSAAQRVRVRANPPLEIEVASGAGLTILKLVAWAERPHERTRDARDLAHILKNYLDAGNSDRLLADHLDLVEVDNFDYALAGARLLGRDISSIGSPETIGKIIGILAIETADYAQYRLIRAMFADSVAEESESEIRFEAQLAILKELKSGIEER